MSAPTLRNDPPNGKTLIAWRIPRFHWLKWGGVLLTVALCVSFLLLQLWVEYRFKPIFLQSTGLPRYQEMKKFWKAPVVFSKECTESVPYSDQLKKAYENLLIQRVKLAKSANPIFVIEAMEPWYQFKKTNSFNLQEMEEQLQSIEPYTQAGLDFVRQVIKDVHSRRPGSLLPVLIDRGGERITVFDLLQFKAYLFAAQNRWEEAFDYHIESFYLLLRNPYQEVSDFCVIRKHLLNHAKRTAEVASSLSSAKSLRSGLQALNQLESFLFQDIFDRIPAMQLISAIRVYADAEYPIQSIEGKTSQYYIHQLAKKNVRLLSFTNCLPAIWQRRGFTQDEIAGLLRPFTISNVLNDYFDLKAFRPMNVARFRDEDRLAGIEYDLLRLTIAAKLYELETGKSVTQTADLVPAYFPQEIKVRKSGAPYTWNGEGEVQRP